MYPLNPDQTEMNVEAIIISARNGGKVDGSKNNGFWIELVLMCCNPWIRGETMQNSELLKDLPAGLSDLEGGVATVKIWRSDRGKTIQTLIGVKPRKTS